MAEIDSRDETYFDWPRLVASYMDIMDSALRSWLPSNSPLFAQNRLFSSGRLDEGRYLGEYLRKTFPNVETIHVLDLGAGNGGVAVGLANYRGIHCVALDVIPTIELRDVVKESGLPVDVISANGERLPFAGNSLDAILCLETIEHVPSPELMCADIMRVLRPGGICIVTTPARARYLFGRDPHAAIPFLVWLPPSLQRWIAERVLSRVPRYDAHRLYWHVQEIAELFPNRSRVDTVWNHQWPGPIGLRNRLWYRFRYFLWDRIVIQKA